MVLTTPTMQKFSQREDFITLLYHKTRSLRHHRNSSHLLLMRRLLIAGAAIAAAAFPSAAIAATSGTVSASVTVGYSCDLTLPSNQLLSVDGTTATASATLPYSQNGDTDYSLTSLSIVSPTGSDISGSITVTDASSATLVTNTSESSSATGTTKAGADTGDGSVAFAISEGTAATFIEGPYSISSTLSCSEAP